jgi:hypothetical protein
VVHYHVHENLALYPIVNHMNPVHTPSAYFFKINFNIIIPSCLGLPSGLFSSGFPTKTFVHFPALPCVLYAPSTLSSLIWWSRKRFVRIQIMELLNTQFTSVSCYILPLRSNWGSIPNSGKRFFSNPQPPDWLWDSPILSIGYTGLFPWG